MYIIIGSAIKQIYMAIGSLKSLYNLIGSRCPSKGLSPRSTTLMSNSIATRPERREKINQCDKVKCQIMVTL